MLLYDDNEFLQELSLPTQSTYEIEETTRGMTVLQEFDSDQPPTYQNQAPNADILDKVIQVDRGQQYDSSLSYSSYFNISPVIIQN
jgi:hypothetical protein